MPQFTFLPHGVDGAARGHFFCVCAVQAGPEFLCSPGCLRIPDAPALTPPDFRGAGEGAWGLVELPSHAASLPLPLQEPLGPPSLHSPTFPEPFNRLQRFYFYLQENSIIDHDLYIPSQAHVGRARVRKAYACALKAITH